MKRKRVLFKAGILLLFLLLVPGMVGCEGISSLIATPTSTPTLTPIPTPTATPTPTPTLTPTATSTPTPTPKPTSTPTPTPAFLVECVPVQVKLKASLNEYPPNIIAMAGQPVGSPVGALQISLSNETGKPKRELSLTGNFAGSFRGKTSSSLVLVWTVTGKWTFMDSGNVYTINGEIAYETSDMAKLFGYYITVSGLGITQVCQSK